MKITQDVREYAAQKEIDEQAALGGGMKEKAEEFIERGARFTRRRNKVTLPWTTSGDRQD